MKIIMPRLRSRHVRALATLTVAASAAGFVILGADLGHPASQVPLRTGTAWLASNQVGQLTLVDGASAQVAAHVPVATPANRLAVTQQDDAAYVLNQATGTLVRVDGATHRVSRPVIPLPDARGTLAITSAHHTLYTVDTHAGTLAATDPKTLAPQRGPRQLATELPSDGLAVDDRGQPWAAEQRTGTLVWLSEGQRRTRAHAALPGTSRLTVTHGQPALVDPARNTAELLDPDSGTVARSVRPNLRPGDTVAVSGSPDQARLLLSVASRGTFIRCMFTTASCGSPLVVAAPRSDLGAPVEVDNHAVVPDYTTGHVSVINLTTMRLVVQRQLFDHPVRFELFARDGIVFFNDPNSNRAGVLDLDGDVRLITKYEHANGSGVDPVPALPVEIGQSHSLDQATSTGPDSGPAKAGPGVPGDSTGPSRTDPHGPAGLPALRPPVSIEVTPRNDGIVGEQFELTLVSRLEAGIAEVHWLFGDHTEDIGTAVHHHWDRPGTYQVSATVTLASGEQAPKAETTIVIHPPGTPPSVDRVNIRRPHPVVDETVHFSADIAGSEPETWRWTISAPGRPQNTSTFTTPELDHIFTAPGDYEISLIVTAGTNSARALQHLTVALGRVYTWGSSNAPSSVPPQASRGVVAIAAGGGHSLALKADGSVIAWGRNTPSTIGSGESGGQASVPPQADRGVVAIAAGSEHSLALKADGTVIGWGNNKWGQASPPRRASRGVIAIAAGGGYSLALKADGSVIGWGLWTGWAPVPAQASSGVIAVAAGRGGSKLALKSDGSVVAWGVDQDWGAVPPQASSGVIAVAVGLWHCLALKSDGSVIIWGPPRRHDPHEGSRTVPPQTTSGMVVAVAAGGEHALFLRDDGSINGYVLDIDGDLFGQASVPPEAASGVIAVAAGDWHSMVLK